MDIVARERVDRGFIREIPEPEKTYDLYTFNVAQDIEGEVILDRNGEPVKIPQRIGRETLSQLVAKRDRLNAQIAAIETEAAVTREG